MGTNFRWEGLQHTLVEMIWSGEVLCIFFFQEKRAVFYLFVAAALVAYIAIYFYQYFGKREIVDRFAFVDAGVFSRKERKHLQNTRAVFKVAAWVLLVSFVLHWMACVFNAGCVDVLFVVYYVSWLVTMAVDFYWFIKKMQAEGRSVKI